MLRMWISKISCVCLLQSCISETSLENSLILPPKFEHSYVPYPAILFLGIHARKAHVYVQQETWPRIM